MIAPAPSRQVVKQLERAGFAKRDGKGSHTLWTCPHDFYAVSLPDGHRTISPGVRRKVEKAINGCSKNCGKGK